jgi:hypothetical protein
MFMTPQEKIEQIKGILEYRFRAEAPRLVHETDRFLYFRAIDADFQDEIEVKVDMLERRVYTRIYIEGIDIDLECEASDRYYHRGTFGEPIVAVFIG